MGILYKYANPIHSLLRKKDDNAGQKSLGRVEGGRERLDLIELLCVYKIAPFYGVSTYGALTLEIETFSVFQFFKVLSIALSTSLWYYTL